MLNKNRVVVTGLGVLAANGNGKDAFWNTLLAGQSGVGPITLCDVQDLKVNIAGEVKNFNPDDYLDGKIKAKRLSRNVQFAVAANRMALQDAQLDSPALSKAAPILIMLGISMGGFDFIESQIRRIVAKGVGAMSPAVIGCLHIAAASTVAGFLDVPTRIGTFSNSCVGGMDAIAEAAAMIREGRMEIAIAGGTDAPIETSLISGFCAARMLVPSLLPPQKASRPFDLKRSGGILAEGCAIVILENAAHALARGARPYLEITGFGSISDNTKESGSGLELSMCEALANASLTPADINYISAHGPSDIEIDRVETDAIKRVFGKHAHRIPVSSIKGATGNPLAAGGAMQLVACCLSCRHNILPPTANYEEPDPLCDLDYVPTARCAVIRHALINSHGIGRLNSSLVVGNWIS
jgi:3-oxoacyl-[acyl-carrier-protein] synthase II